MRKKNNETKKQRSRWRHGNNWTQPLMPAPRESASTEARPNVLTPPPIGLLDRDYCYLVANQRRGNYFVQLKISNYMTSHVRRSNEKIAIYYTIGAIDAQFGP